MVRAISRLAYRAVVPLFLSLPLAWIVLNQFRVALYTGKEPTTEFFLVATAQHCIERTACILLPVVVGVVIHWVFRWIRAPIVESRLHCPLNSESTNSPP